MKNLKKFEIYKFIKNKSYFWTNVVLLLVTLGGIFIYFYNSQMGLGTAPFKRDSIQYNQKIANRYEGKLDDANIKTILSDYLESFKDSRGSDIGSYEPPTLPMDVFSYYIAEDMILGNKSISLLLDKNPDLTIDGIDIKPTSDLGTSKALGDITLASYFSWVNLYAITEMLFIPMIVAVIIIISGVFSNEQTRNIDQLLLSTKYGRNKLSKAKFKASYTTSIMIFMVPLLVVLSAFIYYYGFGGWQGDIQANFYLKTFSFPVKFNNLQVYGLIILLQFINLITMVSVTIVISSYTKSALTSMVSTLGVFILPRGLDKLFKSGSLLNKMQQYFPVNNFQIKNILQGIGNNDVFLSNSFWMNVSIIILLSTLISMVCLFVAYKHQRNYYAS